MRHRGLIGAILYAKDLGRLVDFYSSVVGIEPLTIEKGYAILGSRPSQFVIVRTPKRIADTIDIATPPEPREDTPLKLVFAVEDIAHAQVRGPGVSPMPLHEIPAIVLCFRSDRKYWLPCRRAHHSCRGSSTSDACILPGANTPTLTPFCENELRLFS